ncbi:MAG: M20/M25/M40 family metallo-hydrolase [Deltaproteobacteria bacterium]|nr:M20/M25/M40 family metallo-hydrolase [Deltaproteobacteria bacterium]
MREAGSGGGVDVVRRVDDRLLADLLADAVDAYSPTHAEDPATRVFAAALQRARVPYWLAPVPSRVAGGARANIVVELGPSPPDLLWVGHVDTVPLPDEGAGTPGPRWDGDVLYGLGAADMKSGCAAAVAAAAALVASGATLSRGLAIALVVGEEEYGDGSVALLEHVRAPLVVVGEPTGLVPCLDHYGYEEFLLSSEGSGAHAALPERGANAIQAMLRWLAGVLDRLGSLPAAEAAAINLRHIGGGGETFVVPERCRATLDVHLPPGLDPARVGELVGAARADVLAVAGPGRLRLEYERAFHASAFACDPGDPLLAPVRRGFEAAGVEWAPGAFRSHSDASLFREAGALTFVCGPGRLENAHTPGEHVSFAEVARAARLYAAMFHEACGRC